MAIDLMAEGPGLRPRQAARLVPPFRQTSDADGNPRTVPTHPATITRWILKGARDGHGNVVRLEAVRLPSGWVTTAAALARFIARLTPDQVGPAVPQAPTVRARAAARADQELARLGV